MKRIEFLTPTFPPAHQVAADYAAIASRGIFTNGGPVEGLFTEAVAAWIGNGVSVTALSSATAAIELALQALISDSGSAVLVPSFTFAAGPLAIRRCGLRPLFVDVDPLSWQPSFDDAEELLSRHADVAGILLTSTFGVGNPDISRWEDLARRHRLPLIVDSAAGFGSRYAWDEPLGARGDCEIFSLHATKTLAIGEGGILAARERRISRAVNRLRNFGFDEGRQAVSVGTNAKLTELAAAIGLRQLEVLPHRIAARQNVFGKYVERLAVMGIEFQAGADCSALAFVPALLPTEGIRDALVAELDEVGVASRTYYNPPVHRHAVFREQRPRALPGTDGLASRVISLPMADQLGADAIERIGRAAEAAFRG